LRFCCFVSGLLFFSLFQIFKFSKLQIFRNFPKIRVFILKTYASSGMWWIRRLVCTSAVWGQCGVLGDFGDLENFGGSVSFRWVEFNPEVRSQTDGTGYLALRLLDVIPVSGAWVDFGGPVVKDKGVLSSGGERCHSGVLESLRGLQGLGFTLLQLSPGEFLQKIKMISSRN
jgi:hypothetical protein